MRAPGRAPRRPCPSAGTGRARGRGPRRAPPGSSWRRRSACAEKRMLPAPRTTDTSELFSQVSGAPRNSTLEYSSACCSTASRAPTSRYSHGPNSRNTARKSSPPDEPDHRGVQRQRVRGIVAVRAHRAAHRGRDRAAHRAARHRLHQHHEREHHRHRGQRVAAERADVGRLGDAHRGGRHHRHHVGQRQRQHHRQHRPLRQPVGGRGQVVAACDMQKCRWAGARAFVPAATSVHDVAACSACHACAAGMRARYGLKCARWCASCASSSSLRPRSVAAMMVSRPGPGWSRNCFIDCTR